MFRHFIITRFNLRDKSYADFFEKSGITQEQWMHERFTLFEEYCLPSLLQQTNQNFTWLIYFDPETPIAYKQKMAQIHADHPHIEACYIADFDAFKQQFKSHLVQRAGAAEFLVTSRLDNDDCLHKEAIADIQKQFNKQEKQGVNLARGYCLRMDENALLTEYYYPRSPFVSIIERLVSGQVPFTAMGEEHTQIIDLVPTIQLDEGPRWMQLIHGQNISNYQRGKPIYNPSVLADFAISENKFCFSKEVFNRAQKQFYWRKVKGIVKKMLGRQ